MHPKKKMARSATTTPIAVEVEPQEDTKTRAQEEVEEDVTEIGQETDGITEEGTVVLIGADGTIMVAMMLAAVVITGIGTALTGIVAIVIVMIEEGRARAPDRPTVRNHPFCFCCPMPDWLLRGLYLQ